MKQYNLTGFNEFLNTCITPQQLANELVELMFNYSFCVDEGMIEQFKVNAGTIYMLYNEVKDIREI